MTVSYSAEVATTGLGTFGRLLFRWRGSVYKLIWKEMLIYVLLYVSIALIYHLYLRGGMYAVYFEAWAMYCRKSADIIPLTFVLGFYVSLIIERWWAVCQSIGWPDRACFCVNLCIYSDKPAMAKYRRAIARYLNLAQLLILRDVSTAVKTRFPTMDRIVSDGFMTVEERQYFDTLEGESQLNKHHKYWLIIHWALDVLAQAYDKHAVRDEHAFKLAVKQIFNFRDRIASLLDYDWITIPLSYTQVVTLVVYSYFATNLISKQYFDEAAIKNLNKQPIETAPTNLTNSTVLPSNSDYVRVIEMYLPVFPMLEFLFYMGWLKVAESIMNPLGQDDDDFEINYIINRNLAIAYAIVDTHRSTCPTVKEETAISLPESKVKAKGHAGSATDYNPSKKDDGDSDKDKATKKLSMEDDFVKVESGTATTPQPSPSKDVKETATTTTTECKRDVKKKKSRTYMLVKALVPRASSEPPTKKS